MLRSKLKKLRNGGLPWVIKVIKYRLNPNPWINERLFYHYQKKLPIQENLIVIESEEDFSDNAYVLYEYMLKNGYLDKYHVAMLVNDVKAAQKKHWKNTEFVKKNPEHEINKEWAKVLATCRWYIYDHNNMMQGVKKRQEQIILNLWHGVGYKGTNHENSSESKTTFDYFDTLSDKISLDCQAKFFNCSKEKGIVLGYPRLDYFYSSNNIGKNFIKSLGVTDEKVVLWMPTFRKSPSARISENYDLGETGLPILYTRKMLQDFNKYLAQNSIVIMLKVHHLQADSPIFRKEYSNIKIIKDEQLKEAGLQLYQFVSGTDALITDYSSIAIDYLLMDHPIIFTLDDYAEYEKSRGFIINNAKKYMPGYHVYDFDGLILALGEINAGKDKYEPDRKRIRPLYHTYADGHSSERILNFLKIKL